MYSAISASNDAILRAKTRQELFQWVCDAAVHGSKFSNASILMVDPGTQWVTVAATAGVSAGVVRVNRISVDENLPEGRGTVGTAFRTQKPCITNDFLHDERLKPWYEVARQAGWNSAGVFPLIVRGQSAGVLAFNSFEEGEFSDEVIALLSRVAENVSFALENFLRQEELRESEARFRSLTELSSDWYWEIDDQYRFTRIEGQSAINGEEVPVESFIGLTRWESGLEAEEGWDAHRATLMAHRSFRDTVMLRKLPDGKKRYIAISGEPMYQGERFLGYRGIGREITVQKESEERIRYLAHHDGLTGLPNRLQFSHLLNMSIQLCRRYQRAFGVMFFDLDRFKIINDTLGHEAGDKLLKMVAERVKNELRASDVVARLGGDEFVVLVQEVSEKDQVAAVARKILAAIGEPIVLCGQECRVTASIGIAMFPDSGHDEQTLMKNADMAMYLAKEQGKNNYQFYTEAIKSMSIERLTMEASLRLGVERKEFFLEYQPKLDLQSGTINGVEALVRWQHPELGVIMPNYFIGIAEETGLILAIGRWVIHEACRQNMAWKQQGLPAVCVAVNLSARQFFDNELIADVRHALESTGMEPNLLELEITESMAMQNIDNAIRVLSSLKAMGVRIALDDFGTGYSALSQIKRFPIDTLKVDRSFIRALESNAQDRAITEAIIAMGRTLSLTVVAEGVETTNQENFLRDSQCNESQGFLFSRPLSAEKAGELLRTHRRADLQA